MIRRCIRRLVDSGRISPKVGEDALALHLGMQGRMHETMPPASADAAAALEAARAMAESAREQKLHLAKQAIRSSAIRDRMTTARGQRGVEATKIIDETEARIENVLGALFRRFNTGLEAYRSRFAGLSYDLAGPRNLVRELFGVDTGDMTAKAAADAWRRTTEYARTRAKAAGKVFEVLEDWRLPQFWEASRVRQFGEAEFIRDLRSAVEQGALTVFDRQSMSTVRIGAPDERRPLQQVEALETVLKRAYENITADQWTPSIFTPLFRAFQFQEGQVGAEAWLRLMAKYGAGQDVMSMLRTHLNYMARDVGAAEILGPRPNATVRMVLEMVEQEEKAGTNRQRVARAVTLTSSQSIEKAWRIINGRADQVRGELMAGVFGALRSLSTAVNLGSAVVSAVPGDTVTLGLTSAANGLGVSRVLSRLVREIAAGPDARARAARLNVVAHAAIDTGLAGRRFEDQASGPEFMQKIATFVIRAQGLQRWTEAGKRAFTMELLGLVAEQSNRRWERLDTGFRRFLERHRFASADWNQLRATPALEVEGARFFDVEAVAPEARDLGRRLMDAIILERREAIIEPSARVSGLTSGGLERGTLAGEIMRSTFMFKSFPITVALVHLLPAFIGPDRTTRRGRTAAYVLLATMSGAASIWAKDLLAGRDPRPMDTPAFWLAAFAQGGGGGIYGDFLYSATSRAGTQPLVTLGGPLATQLEQVIRLGHQGYREYADPDNASFGTQLARVMKTFTPGSSLWYARLALDRAVYDQIARLIDPDGAEASFRRMRNRMRRETETDYWWRPGRATPERAPNLGGG